LPFWLHTRGAFGCAGEEGVLRVRRWAADREYFGQGTNTEATFPAR
jgi:hypothetical protein